MTDVTRILNQIENGDPAASEQLLPLVYEELRFLARQRLNNEKPGQTLQATALVHEAYLRLVGNDNDQSWDNRGHFFAAAAEAMRRIVVEIARRRGSLKQGGDWKRQTLTTENIEIPNNGIDILELDDALDHLASKDQIAADLVKLRFFTGLTQEDAAKALNIPRRSADRIWQYARAVLSKELSKDC
jgi:RNA polymerase sigma factor (TIGR02999 family)